MLPADNVDQTGQPNSPKKKELHTNNRATGQIDILMCVQRFALDREQQKKNIEAKKPFYCY